MEIVNMETVLYRNSKDRERVKIYRNSKWTVKLYGSSNDIN